MKSRALDWVCYGTAALLAYALKRFYSTADVSELKFVLAPTARVVELLSGKAFAFESGVGFVNLEWAVAITKACSGVNFLIVAFLSLVLAFTHRFAASHGRSRIGWFFFSGVLAYAVTVVTNALRVMVAGYLHREHLIEGVILYLGALWLIHATVSRWLDEEPFRRGGRGAHSLTWLVPLACYLGMTLVVPLVNGVALDQDFALYAGKVLGMSLMGAGVMVCGAWESVTGRAHRTARVYPAGAFPEIQARVVPANVPVPEMPQQVQLKTCVRRTNPGGSFGLESSAEHRVLATPSAFRH